MFNWSQYSQYAKVKTLQKGTVLYRQGDVLNGFYYLKEGKVMISTLREDGYERIIDFVFPGTLIGEQLLDGNASFTTATLLMDSTLYYFSKNQFEKLTIKYPNVTLEFGYSLIKKLRVLADINSMKKAPVDVQLAHFLLNLREKKGDSLLEINQTSISKFIGKSRVAVWRVLKEWRAKDIVEISNQEFMLKDIKTLQEIEESKLQSI